MSGAPPPELDPASRGLDSMLEPAAGAGQLAEAVRLLVWLWLDAPAGPEGRVSGPGRPPGTSLITAVEHLHPEGGSGASGVAAYQRSEEIRVPVTADCGDLDLPDLGDRTLVVAHRVAGGADRTPAHTAHLPQPERPEEVAALIFEAFSAAGPPAESRTASTT